ncbi:MAG: cytochrome d ubiquinol oxidase subunit II [Bacteroidota bacterium]|nr:cytochrome d ubiquinol oxidase subunit II [Bacteroidota bacterium]
MFESFSYLFLQQYWWTIISLLGSLLVFLMFVQGGQTLIYTLGETEEEKTMIINSLGRKWELTFTTLVTFGGAFFASFPLFYSTSFGGAYWVWMTILFSFVIQAVSYEYRRKPGNFLGARTFEIFLMINGFLGTILIGTAVGTFYNGAMFSIDQMHFSKWETPYGGLEAILTFHNVALGVSVYFLSRILGALYLMNSINDNNIRQRAKTQVWYNAIPFLIFFLYFLITLLLKDSFSYDRESGFVYIEPYKYLHNLIHMPVVLVFLLSGIVLVLCGIWKGAFKSTSISGIWFAGSGTILTVFSLFLIAGLNHTAFYPSVADTQSSLTIENASSSKFTLTIMSYVSLLVPFVLAYIWYAWKSMDNRKIDAQDMKENTHVY